jgi:hypothetical protein
MIAHVPEDPLTEQANKRRSAIPTYQELATGWENRELEPLNFRQSSEAVLIDFQ